jgi:uncharacterized membrane protein YkvA (DUF1232 family)
MKKFLKENWLLVVGLLYLISPIDFISDIIPIVGTVDDAGLLLIELIRRYSDILKASDIRAKNSDSDKS